MVSPGHVQFGIGRFVYLIVQLGTVAQIIKGIDLGYVNKFPFYGLAPIVQETILVIQAHHCRFFKGVVFIARTDQSQLLIKLRVVIAIAADDPEHNFSYKPIHIQQIYN